MKKAARTALVGRKYTSDMTGEALKITWKYNGKKYVHPVVIRD